MTGEGAHIRPVDVAVVATATTVDVVTGVGRVVAPAMRSIAGAALRPPLVPERLQPAAWLEALTRSGEARRAALTARLSRFLDELVPLAVEEVLRRAEPTDLVLRYVDLDRVVSTVDLDAVVAQVDVAAVVERVDVDAVVERVDVAAVVERVDLDAAARRLDIDAVLDRLDLTAVVLRRVDLRVLIEAVLDRIDLVGLAAEVIDGVDLPEIIRESTGTMASDTIRGVRMQGIVADEAVGRAVDRLLLRGRDRGHPAT